MRSDSTPDYSFNNCDQVVYTHVPPSASSNVNSVIQRQLLILTNRH